jgi:hypothetical protein
MTVQPAALLDLTSDEYHQDPCPVASLNSTTARLLLDKTPAHAKAHHPRLWDTPPPAKESDAFDLGTAVHQLLLRDDRIEVGDWPDYRKADAREWRDSVRAAGRVPMLRARWEQSQDVAGAIRERMLTIQDPRPFTAGTPETTITWQDTGGAHCRARLDWLRDDLTLIDDLKTTSKTADPRQWKRQLFNLGYDVQAAFYLRGVKAYLGDMSHPIHTRFRWIVVETTPPYAASVVVLSERALESARAKVDTAIGLWNECMATGVWPSYPVDEYEADLPGWALDAADRWGEVDELEEVPF